MRILIFGNSGSGKSTLARRLSSKHGIPILDLDGMVWSRSEYAVLRPEADILADLMAFVRSNDSWIIEGCYGRVIARLLGTCTGMIFVNPGEAACLRNCRARPWEPDKYASKSAQDEKLPLLLARVSAYYSRSDDMSFAAHRHLYESFTGPKREVKQNEPDA